MFRSDLGWRIFLEVEPVSARLVIVLRIGVIQTSWRSWKWGAVGALKEERSWRKMILRRTALRSFLSFLSQSLRVLRLATLKSQRLVATAIGCWNWQKIEAMKILIIFSKESCTDLIPFVRCAKTYLVGEVMLKWKESCENDLAHKPFPGRRWALSSKI